MTGIFFHVAPTSRAVEFRDAFSQIVFGCHRGGGEVRE